MKPDSKVLDLCRQQGGVVHRKQARAAGLSYRQVDYRLARGDWIKLRDCVYQHLAFPESDRSRLFALTLGGAGHVSHRHAARLFGLDLVQRAKPEVTTRTHLGISYPGVITHESKQLESVDLTWIDGLPVSGIERTIMDCAAVLHQQWVLLALIDQALRMNLTNPAKLRGCLAIHAKRGRNGTVNFRRALEHITDAPPPIGHLSRQAAQIVTAGGLPEPKFEQQICDAHGNFIAQVDASWPIGYVHFYDGFTHHRARRDQTNRDIVQRARLRNEGFVVDEFTYDQINNDPAFVLRTSIQGYARALARFRGEAS
ncbi:MAG: hypothetical protein ACR2NL_11290 [Acidimicrobiia bacterium]